ncbi:MAG TPA: formimidoylglutamase [Flavitalea sp.]|nr:formimidoylglutamase [Flavitalea sp.]
MPSQFNLDIFLEPVPFAALSEEEGYLENQFGKSIAIYEDTFPDLDEIDIVLVGCGEQRGMLMNRGQTHQSPNTVRKKLYALHYWHPDTRIADIGNIVFGATLTDTYAALRTVIQEITAAGKTIVILGGSHDLTLAQYQAVSAAKTVVEATGVDAMLDLNFASSKKSEQFLLEMLTSEPNFIRHYNHIGFQSYFVDPNMLETMDKLRFDCYRLGHVKENIEEMEPVIRNSSLFTFDINSIAHAYAPANELSPNGFTGDEACALARYAGLSRHVNSIGIYGFDATKDKDGLTAMQIAQMLWYIVDGKSRSKRESAFEDKDAFNEFHTAFAEVETTFLQSKRTGRWWMQLPDNKFIACSYKDYVLASSNEIPERWLRAQERS